MIIQQSIEVIKNLNVRKNSKISIKIIGRRN